jgi:hypothetical protein
MDRRTVLDTQDKLQKYVNDYLSRTPTRGGIVYGGELWLMNLNGFTSLEGITFPNKVVDITIIDTEINTLKGTIFPSGLTRLYIRRNKLTSLNDAVFPDSLKELTINNGQITALDGVRFPSGLDSLNLNDNQITSLKGCIFPLVVTSLSLSNNKITSFEGMKFPFSLVGMNIVNNPINPQTVTLIERPTETVIREIVRAYPQTASYFDSQREFEQLTMLKLQNHVQSIAKFLQPLIVERKAKEEALISAKHTPVLFVNTPNGQKYSIPFNGAQTVQSAIDYLEQNYLLSVMNSCVKINITKDSNPLDPVRTFADNQIEIQDTLTVLQNNSLETYQQGGRKQTKHNRLKLKKGKSRKYKSMKC